jgi:hypothetical protein
VTAINFGPSPVDETVLVPGAMPDSIAGDVLNPGPALRVGAGGSLRLSLEAFEGKALRLKGRETNVP